MQFRRPRGSCAFLLSMALCGALAPSARAAPPPPPARAALPDAGYTVKPGDILAVSVWKEPDLQGPVLVRPDGAFSFPLAGQMDARGKTVQELQQLVTERLKKFISDPVVTVSIQEIKGNKVYVIGQVNKPGDFIVNPRVDVMQALSMAGGTTPFAALGDIMILRRTEGGQQQALPFRYTDVIRGRNLDQNITLQAGDVVVVP
ncbi:MAG: polysaccharide export outer membrane protein [Gammaproteobacteria bacterium]|nr:polysaccharide export outer membrane protein [Gammaproteobacteria bacterium]